MATININRRIVPAGSNDDYVASAEHIEFNNNESVKSAINRALSKSSEPGNQGPQGDPGKDGITPEFRINNGRWEVSYDGGNTWIDLGVATGANGETPLFKIENGYLYYKFQGGSWTQLGKISGEDGNSIEFVYMLSNTLFDTFPDVRKPKTSWPFDGISNVSKEDNPYGWTDDPQNMSKDFPYQYISCRYGNDTTKGAWSEPVLWTRWVDASLSEDEKNEIITNVTNQVGSELLGSYVRVDDFNNSVTDADAKYNNLKNRFDGMESTVNEFGTYVGATGFSKLVQNASGLNALVVDLDKKQYSELVNDVNGIHTTVYGRTEKGEQGLVQKLTTFESTLDGISTEVGTAKTNADAALTQLSSLTITPDQIVLASDENKKIFDENGNLTSDVINSSGLLTTNSASTLYAAKSEFETLSDNVSELKSTVDGAELNVLPEKIDMAVMSGRYLMNEAGELIDEDGNCLVYFYTAADNVDWSVVPEGQSPFVWHDANSKQFWTFDNEGKKVNIEYDGTMYLACMFDTEFEHEGVTYRAIEHARLTADAMSNIKLDSNSIELSVQDALEKKGSTMASIMLRAMDDDSSIKISAKNIDIDGLVNNLTAKKISTSDSGSGHIDVQDNFMQMYSSDGDVKLAISSDDVPLDSGIKRYTTSSLHFEESWIQGTCDDNQEETTVQMTADFGEQHPYCEYDNKRYVMVGTYIPDPNAASVSIKTVHKNDSIAEIGGLSEGREFSIALSSSDTAIENPSILTWSDASVDLNTQDIDGHDIKYLSNILKDAKNPIYIWVHGSTDYNQKHNIYDSSCQVADSNIDTFSMDFYGFVIETAGADSYQMKIGANGLTISLKNNFGVVIAKDDNNHQLIKLFGNANGVGSGIVLNDDGLYIGTGNQSNEAYKVGMQTINGYNVLCLDQSNKVNLW